MQHCARVKCTPTTTAELSYQSTVFDETFPQQNDHLGLCKIDHVTEGLAAIFLSAIVSLILSYQPIKLLTRVEWSRVC